MNFLDRTAEMARLDRLLKTDGGALGVVWGRRRVGKSRLLIEWSARNGGVYTVAEVSAPAIQRTYLAQALEGIFPHFADVTYPDWAALLRRIAEAAGAKSWRGPLVFDEFPYWVVADPTLPSVMQKWVDTTAREAGLVVVIAGSSQRMMQGLVLDANAPLYGRATEAFALQPLTIGWLGEALGLADPVSTIEAYSVWGGVPRYLELARPFGGDLDSAVHELVLDTQGVLNQEPCRLLLEELPPAPSLRPILDSIGLGAHRLSEIAGRTGMPATSLSHPLTRLQELGLVARVKPYGDGEKGGKRSLYRISDPFFRMWFRVVASHLGEMARSTRAQRLAIWRRHECHLVALAWEELCRDAVSRLPQTCAIGTLGPWRPAGCHWDSAHEWDVVALSEDGERLLLGEAKWIHKPATGPEMRRALLDLEAKGVPQIPGADKCDVIRAVFVPQATRERPHCCVVTAPEIVLASRM